MSAHTRAPGPVPYNNTNYGHDNLNPDVEADENISKSSESTPYDGATIEQIPSERRGSAISQTTLREGSSYKTLNRYQASLIYITNQVGIGKSSLFSSICKASLTISGILSLPTAMQTLGLVPCIITIIGMG
jgi:hypothetical protein